MPLAPSTLGPLLVGVIDNLAALAREAARKPAERRVDLIEARIDLFGSAAPRANWMSACARLESSGTPVIVTVRLAAQGGGWTAPDEERRAVYRAAIDVASWIDIEAASPIAVEISRLAHAGRRTVLASHHDFERTPPLSELLHLVDGCRAVGGDVAKVATTVTGEDDAQALLDLVARRPERTCVIGMGAKAAALRVTLPVRGSLLAYGYLDHPTAPGQLSAAEMDGALRAASPSFAARRAQEARKP